MKLIVLILAAGIAFSQTTRYPGALDNDTSLFVVNDNVQTTLSTAMATSDTAAVVASVAGFAPNMIATICDTTTNTGKCTAWEHMLVTAVAGNVLTVTRAFAGTTARAHSSGRLVSALIDSAHQKVLKDSVLAIETALGPNLSNISASGPLISAGSYNFAAYSCSSGSSCAPAGPSGMGLIAGNNTLTMTPVPPGVNGTDTGHAVYISGGTGTAEACLITGGSGTSGQASGQIIINCGGTHSGAWTITSGTGGIQEAICGLPAAGGNVVVTLNVTLRSNVTACGKTSVTVQKQAGVTISGAFTILGNTPLTTTVETYNNSGVNTQFSILDPGPNFATITTIHDTFRVAVNGFPVTQQQAGNVFGVSEAIAGAIDIPATATAAINSTGVAGYARTASSPNAAVGLLGSAIINANGGVSGISAFGGNFLTQNCNDTATGACVSNIGFTNINLYGVEIDVGIVTTSGGGTPAGNALGLYVIGGSLVQPSGSVNAIDIAPLGAFAPIVGWKYGLVIEDGASTQSGISIGATGTGNGIRSQTMSFQGRSSGGGAETSTIYGDEFGNFTVVPGTGGGMHVLDPSLNLVLYTGTNTVSLGPTTTFTAPGIKSTTGQRYVCVTTTGQLVSSATACSGT